MLEVAPRAGFRLVHKKETMLASFEAAWKSKFNGAKQPFGKHASLSLSLFLRPGS
jgi:hypothetical protein